MTGASTREQAADLICALSIASGSTGDRIAIQNALPHFVFQLGPDDYKTALRNLGVRLEETQASRRGVRSNDCPCLFLDDDGRVLAILDVSDGEQLVLAPGEGAPKWRPAEAGEGVALRFAPKRPIAEQAEVFDLLGLARSFGGMLAMLLVASLLTNIAALAAPLLVMTIYDRVIPTKSIDTVFALVVAVVVVVILDLAIRIIRGQAVAFMGSQVERKLGLALFEKLLSLPVAQLNRSNVHSQVARLRQFESLRDIFSGPLLSTCLDLPFVFIFVAVLFYLSQPIGFLLLGAIAVFFIAAIISLKVQRTLNEKSAAAKTVQQSLLFETSTNIAAIQRLGAEGYWYEQLDLTTQTTAELAQRAKRAQLVAQTFGQSLMMAAGIGTIAFGTIAAIGGDMTLGALIALMTLVWRVLGPVQSLYSSVVQIRGFAASARQIRHVLALEGELTRDPVERRIKSLSGRIDLVNVSHRYDPNQEPVLAGVNLSIKPGQLTVFCGLSGSGRSTLFQLVNRLYAPSSGAIFFDKVDYRQIEVDDLRRTVTFERQNPEFFHGTIRQNFELANPIVSQAEIDLVIDTLGLRADVDALPDGLDTRLDEAFQRRISQSLAKSFGLARCLLRDTRVYLFDDPCAGLDEEREHRFLTCLKAMRGARTVLFTSDRPSHWELADHLVFLDRGRVQIDEPRATALPKIKALYQQARSAG